MANFNLFHNKNHIENYPANSIIFEQGDAGKFMYDIIEGEVTLQRNNKKLVKLGKGEIFGETGLINNEAHSVTAITTKDSQIVKISQRQFHFMVTETPNFALKVMSVLAERLSKETAKNLQ